MDTIMAKSPRYLPRGEIEGGFLRTEKEDHDT